MSWARSWPRAGSLFISLKLLRAAIRWVSNRDAIVLHHLLAKLAWPPSYLPDLPASACRHYLTMCTARYG